MIDRAAYVDLVGRALAEDLGAVGDLTSDSCVPEETQAHGTLVARSAGIVAGLEVAAHVFEAIDPASTLTAIVSDGDRVTAGQSIATVAGLARSLLRAERTALNILGRMSGVATATSLFVAAVEGTGARISDTRKTMPGMRLLDKYAVSMGGGVNHRLGLFDAVLIKDNHISAIGGIEPAVKAARERVGPEVMVEVEVETLQQLEVVLGTEADRVLLDNMDLETLRLAVEMTAGQMVTEASGGVTLDNVRSIASTGVDVISVGWITHSAPQMDIALDFLT
ncbi:MAG TPA: carboxylating nicotinate-nucleotide diphosphorylase [Acidimicrobiia bacterium]|nr:carboxylating nicotinate-nucleotide diphosphorylase [Acidimicrobiia bacterium]